MKFKSHVLSVAIAQALLISQPNYAAEADEVIVRFRDAGVGAQSQSLQAAESMGAFAIQKIPNHGDIVLLKKQDGVSMDELLQSLRSNPDILYAEPNVEFQIPDPEPDAVYSAAEAAQMLSVAGVPNDPLLTWGYEDIDADLTPPAPANAPLVAVIDTGVDYTHPELAGRVVLGRDLHNNDNDPMDDHGHGTHVAGIIAATADNGLGSAGISPTSRILALKVLGATGSGSGWNVIQGVYEAADHPDVKVINMSLGTLIGTGSFLDAIKYAAEQKGKLVVVAAGNSNTSLHYFPASWSHYVDGVIGVAANDRDGCKAWFSNYGVNATIAAPGLSILSTLPNNSYASWSGTSMATPFAVGVAARVLADNPSLTNVQLKAVLEDNADPLVFDGSCWPSNQYHFDHLNLAEALTGSSVNPPLDTTPPTIEIQSPVADGVYETDQGYISVVGTASDDTGIDQVIWRNGDGNPIRTATGTQFWTIERVLLYWGENVITITARDKSGNASDAILRVTRVPEEPDGTVTVNLQVTTGEDDAFEHLRSGKVTLNRKKVPLGKGKLVGYHFANVAVPQNAIIVSATLSEQNLSKKQRKDVSLAYWGEASNDAAPFARQRFDLSQRAKTLEVVTHHIQARALSAFEANLSPDLGDIVQEIISQPDWQSGNALNLFVEDQGSEGRLVVNHYEKDPNSAAQLEIRYTLPTN